MARILLIVNGPDLISAEESELKTRVKARLAQAGHSVVEKTLYTEAQAKEIADTFVTDRNPCHLAVLLYPSGLSGKHASGEKVQDPTRLLKALRRTQKPVIVCESFLARSLDDAVHADAGIVSIEDSRITPGNIIAAIEKIFQPSAPTVARKP